MRPGSLQARALFRRTCILPILVGVMILPLVAYVRTWQSFTAVVDICPTLFCDFVEYYYPMGEAIFRSDLIVEGFFYSPFNAILLAVFAPLGLDASLVLWGVLEAFSVSIYVLLFLRLVPAGLWIQLLFVALTLSSYPLLLNLMGGQVGVFMVVPLLGMLVLYERRRRIAAAGLLAFAVSFKFYPIIFIATFAARRDTRFLLLVVAACGTVLFVVPALLLGAGNTLRFYGALFNSFRESGWVVTNPHSQFLPHVVTRLADTTGQSPSTGISFLHWIAYGVAVANMGLVFLVQHTRLRFADLWGLQLLFLTIPFVLKTSWPHDFVFLPFTQAFMVWLLLERERAPQVSAAVAFSLLLVSIVVSNVVFFNLFGSFSRYDFYAFLFWANLGLLIAAYVMLLPPALRRLRVTQVLGK